MKLLLRCFCALLFIFSVNQSSAQCSAGYSATAINWDALAFLKEGSGTVTNAIATNQNFAFGKNKLTITHNYTAANTEGDNTIHTGETGSFGAGADIQFIGNGIITHTFQTAVQNVKFSVHDIDYNQRVTITALNDITPVIINMTRVAGTVLTIVGNGTTIASATAEATTALANTSNTGSINVTIAGTVSSFKIEVTQTGTKETGPAKDQEDGSFFISDVSACSVTNPFPTAYRSVSMPYTNQPGYVLTALNAIIYMVNPVTGHAVELFRDPSNQNINSTAYDPYNKILYFTNSLTGTNTRTLKKYDFKTETLSVVLSDITTIGVPVFGAGVESGGASFYDGALYLGIEGTGSSRSIVWRIDFDASLNPVSAVQAFGISLTGHDWGDFVIANGILYDFDGGASGNENVYHLNLQTGEYDAVYGSLNFTIRQAGADWQDKIYNIGADIAPYNNNGTIATAQLKFINQNGVPLTGSWGDGAEAFKPKSDFGDAPASFDPDIMAPAMHDIDVNLRIGAALSYEWDKKTSLDATGDTNDDGLAFVRIMNLSGGNYQTDVNVFNNTGANATVCAWADFNGDGIFQASEGISQVVASSASTQTISLYWTNILNNLASNSNTFLRIRITSAANGMTTANATGYFRNGEVEDYYVMVNATVLPVNLLSFTAVKENEKKVMTSWKIADDKKGNRYELQHSIDSKSWTTITNIVANANEGVKQYWFTDDNIASSIIYYRLKYQEAGGEVQYSKVQKVVFNTVSNIQLYPNPAINEVKLVFDAHASSEAQVSLRDASGKIVSTYSIEVRKGGNTLTVPVHQLTNGFYTIQLTTPYNHYIEKLFVQKKL